MIGIHRTCCCDLTADFILPNVDPGGSSNPTCDLDYAFWCRYDPHGEPPESTHDGPMCLAVGYPLNFTGSVWPRHQSILNGCSLPSVNFQLIFNPDGLASRTYSNFIQGNRLYFPFMIHTHQRPWRTCPTETQYQPACLSSNFRYPVSWCNNYVDYGWGIDDGCHDLYPNLQWEPTAWSWLEQMQLESEGLGHVWETMRDEQNQARVDERNYRAQYEYGDGTYNLYPPPGLCIRQGLVLDGGEWGYSFGDLFGSSGQSSYYAPQFLLRFIGHPVYGSGYVSSSFLLTGGATMKNAAWPIANGYSILSALIMQLNGDPETPLSCGNFHDKDIYHSTPFDFDTDIFDRFTIVATSSNPKIRTIDGFPGFNYSLDHPRRTNFFFDFLPRPSNFTDIAPDFASSSWFDFLVQRPSYFYYGEVNCNDSCWT